MMKFKRLSLLCLLVMAAFSFNSCSDDEPDSRQYIDYEYGVEVLEGYSLIYDVTCTYTNIFTNELETKTVGNLGESSFSGHGEGTPKAKEVVFKVEGKLKPNAKELVEEAIAKHRTFSIGYKCRGKAYVYSDPECTNFVKELFSFRKSSEVTTEYDAEYLKYYLDNYPTIEIYEIHHPVE